MEFQTEIDSKIASDVAQRYHAPEEALALMRRRLPIHSVHFLQIFPSLLLALLGYSTAMAAGTHRTARSIAVVVEGLKKELGIHDSVEIKLVQENPLGLSVQPAPGHRGGFLLTIDSQLLRQLDNEQLKAALAHELGHVWVYTHHPYLQTEALANEIAMRVVTRNSLKKLYSEVWAFEGTSGNLDQLLGVQQEQHVVKTAAAKQ